MVGMGMLLPLSCDVICLTFGFLYTSQSTLPFLTLNLRRQNFSLQKGQENAMTSLKTCVAWFRLIVKKKNPPWRCSGSGHGTAQLWNNYVLRFGTQKNWIGTWHSSALEQLCIQVWNNCVLSFGTTVYSALEQLCTQLWNNYGTTVYSALEQLCT